MDRGIPTEETLASMREGDAPVRYLVGTPKGRLTRLEKTFLDLPWQEVRQARERQAAGGRRRTLHLVRSDGRLHKERSMRQRRLKKLWRRLAELQGQSNGRDQLMLKLGAAKKEAGPGLEPGRHPRARYRQGTRRQRLLIPPAARSAAPRPPTRGPLSAAFQHGRRGPRHALAAVHEARRYRAGVQGTQHDLAVRPIFHQREERIEAHIFVSFIAYCLLVTLKNLARPQANGLHRAPLSRRSPPSRWWMSTCRPPTADTSSAAPHPAEQEARTSAEPTRHDIAATASAADPSLTEGQPPHPVGAL